MKTLNLNQMEQIEGGREMAGGEVHVFTACADALIGLGIGICSIYINPYWSNGICSRIYLGFCNN